MTSGPTVSHAICFVSAEAVLTTARVGRRVHYGSGTPPAPLCAERTPRGHGTREWWCPGSRRLSKR